MFPRRGIPSNRSLESLAAAGGNHTNATNNNNNNNNNSNSLGGSGPVSPSSGGTTGSLVVHSQQQHEVIEFLKHAMLPEEDLENYRQIFDDQLLRTWGDIREMGEERLASFGVKRGHARRIFAEIERRERERAAAQRRSQQQQQQRGNLPVSMSTANLYGSLYDMTPVQTPISRAGGQFPSVASAGDFSAMVSSSAANTGVKPPRDVRTEGSSGATTADGGSAGAAAAAASSSAASEQQVVVNTSARARNDPMRTAAVVVPGDFVCNMCCELLYSARTLHCGHTFCCACLERWANSQPHHPTCPLCRASMTPPGATVFTMPAVNSVLESLAQRCFPGRYARSVRIAEDQRRADEEIRLAFALVRHPADALLVKVLQGHLTIPRPIELLMLRLPRREFLPPAFQHTASRIECGSISPTHVEGFGFNMTAPSLHATILQALQLEPGHWFMDAGAGTGIVAAWAAALVGPSGMSLAVDHDAGAARLMRRNRVIHDQLLYHPTVPLSGATFSGEMHLVEKVQIGATTAARLGTSAAAASSSSSSSSSSILNNIKYESVLNPSNYKKIQTSTSATTSVSAAASNSSNNNNSNTVLPLAIQILGIERSTAALHPFFAPAGGGGGGAEGGGGGAVAAGCVVHASVTIGNSGTSSRRICRMVGTVRLAAKSENFPIFSDTGAPRMSPAANRSRPSSPTSPRSSFGPNNNDQSLSDENNMCDIPLFGPQQQQQQADVSSGSFIKNNEDKLLLFSLREVAVFGSDDCAAVFNFGDPQNIDNERLLRLTFCLNKDFGTLMKDLSKYNEQRERDLAKFRQSLLESGMSLQDAPSTPKPDIDAFGVFVAPAGSTTFPPLVSDTSSISSGGGGGAGAHTASSSSISPVARVGGFLSNIGAAAAAAASSAASTATAVVGQANASSSSSSSISSDSALLNNNNNNNNNNTAPVKDENNQQQQQQQQAMSARRPCQVIATGTMHLHDAMNVLSQLKQWAIDGTWEPSSALTRPHKFHCLQANIYDLMRVWFAPATDVECSIASRGVLNLLTPASQKQQQQHQQQQQQDASLSAVSGIDVSDGWFDRVFLACEPQSEADLTRFQKLLCPGGRMVVPFDSNLMLVTRAAAPNPGEEEFTREALYQVGFGTFVPVEDNDSASDPSLPQLSSSDEIADEKSPTTATTAAATGETRLSSSAKAAKRILKALEQEQEHRQQLEQSYSVQSQFTMSPLMPPSRRKSSQNDDNDDDDGGHHAKSNNRTSPSSIDLPPAAAFSASSGQQKSSPVDGDSSSDGEQDGMYLRCCGARLASACWSRDVIDVARIWGNAPFSDGATVCLRRGAVADTASAAWSSASGENLTTLTRARGASYLAYNIDLCARMSYVACARCSVVVGAQFVDEPILTQPDGPWTGRVLLCGPMIAKKHDVQKCYDAAEFPVERADKIQCSGCDNGLAISSWRLRTEIELRVRQLPGRRSGGSLFNSSDSNNQSLSGLLFSHLRPGSVKVEAPVLKTISDANVDVSEVKCSNCGQLVAFKIMRVRNPFAKQHFAFALRRYALMPTRVKGLPLGSATMASGLFGGLATHAGGPGSLMERIYRAISRSFDVGEGTQFLLRDNSGNTAVVDGANLITWRATNAAEDNEDDAGGGGATGGDTNNNNHGDNNNNANRVTAEDGEQEGRSRAAATTAPILQQQEEEEEEENSSGDGRTATNFFDPSEANAAQYTSQNIREMNQILAASLAADLEFVREFDTNNVGDDDAIGASQIIRDDDEDDDDDDDDDDSEGSSSGHQRQSSSQQRNQQQHRQDGDDENGAGSGTGANGEHGSAGMPNRRSGTREYNEDGGEDGSA